jgi:hypothetical protein
MAGDFNLIKGIGPVLAGRLHNAGIRTFIQLASLSPVKLAARVSGLSAKRIARQEWIGQARKLSRKKPQPKSYKNEIVTPTIRQHYENFTIEFLLDEKNVARRTRIMHVQSGDADTWAGWEAEQLIDFLARHAKVRIPTVKFAPNEAKLSRRDASQNATGESSSKEIPIPELVPPLSTKVNLALPVTEMAMCVLPSPAVVDLAGKLHLRELKVVLIDSNIPISFLRQGQPYLVRLTLDLTEVVAPSDAALIFKATINFKQLGGSSQPVVEASSTLKFSDGATLEIVGNSLPPGIYRLDAFVRLTSSDKATPGLTAFLKGNLLQVY